MGNFAGKELEESSRLKEKACENCMGKLKGVLSDKQIQQFREEFYAASEGYMFQKSRDFPGRK